MRIRIKKKIEKKIINHSKKFFNDKFKIVNKGLIVAPKVKILNDKLSERVSLIKKNQKTLSILCGKLDAAPLAFEKINNLIRKTN